MADAAASTATADLEKRVTALESGAKYDATQAEIRAREAEFLETLREIRASMAADAGAAAAAPSADLVEENKQLKKKVEKQEYRIRLLISNLEEFMNAAAK